MKQTQTNKKNKDGKVFVIANAFPRKATFMVGFIFQNQNMIFVTSCKTISNNKIISQCFKSCGPLLFKQQNEYNQPHKIKH